MPPQSNTWQPRLAVVRIGTHQIPESVTTTSSQPVSEKACKWNFTGVEEELVLTDHSLMWYECGILRRKFGFPDDVITHALFTHFDDPSPPSLDDFAASTNTDGSRRKSGKNYGQLRETASKRPRLERKRAIVIFLKEYAHIFFLSGARYVVNIPFTIKSVFATDRGLIIERNVTDNYSEMPFLEIPDSPISPQILPRFFSLTDPMAEAGLVVKSSLSGVDAHSFSDTEGLVFLSDQTPKGHGSLLAATYDTSTGMVNAYQFKYLSTDGIMPARRRTFSRRRSSFVHSMTEESISGVDMSPIDKGRTSLLRTDISLTLDRMGVAGVDMPDVIGNPLGLSGVAPPILSWWYDAETLPREIEFSLIESLAFNAAEATCFTVVDHHQKRQALAFFNKHEGYLMLLIFNIETSNIQFEDSTKIRAKDAVPLCGAVADDLRHPHILILLPDNNMRLYDPFLKRYSPSLPIHETVTELKHAMHNRVSLRRMDGSLLRIEIVQSPKSSFVTRLLQVVNSMIDPVQQLVLSFQFSAAIHQLQASNLSVNEWDGFVIAILASLMGPGAFLENQLGTTETDIWTQFLEQDRLDDSSNRYLVESQSWYGLMTTTDASVKRWPYSKHAEMAIKLATEMNTANNPHSDWIRVRGIVVTALHLFAEELKLDIAASESKQKLDILLGQLVRWLGWSGPWKQTYTHWSMIYDECMLACYVEIPNNAVPRFKSPEVLHEPPNIFSILYSTITVPSVPTITTLYDLRIHHRPAQAVGSKKQLDALLPKTKLIKSIFTILVSSPPETVYRDIVEKLIVSLPISNHKSSSQNKGRALMNEIERFPESIVIVLKEAIIWCQENTPIEWGVDALELIGRRDLKKLVELGNGGSEVEIGRHLSSRDKAREISQIVQSFHTEAETLGPWDGVSEVDRANVSRLIFRDDRRMQEVQKLLQTTRMQSGKFEYGQLSSSFNEADIHTAQQELARMIGTRTLAVPIGRGAFLYSARVPLLTEKFPIPKMNFNIVMMPSMATITVDKNVMNEETISWGLFHNGVASGLSVSKEAKVITGSWIVFNKPAELNAQHAGFLLGLGLNGHLKNLAEWHIYNYLRPKHTLTSIALLLGMSTSYLGTMNAKMTKVLSVHVVALLPAGSADLNISSSMQTAGIMGVGLLYYRSNHRRMSEILISEIDKYNPSGIIPDGRRPGTGAGAMNAGSNPAGVEDTASGGADSIEQLRDEGYLLAAGFALGLINISSGSYAAVLEDLHLMERLLAIGTGSSSALAAGGSGGRSMARKLHLLDKSAAGCIVALLLIYLKTEDRGVAEKVDVPETEILFEYVRPDLLLLRTLASRLIMWSSIGKSCDWIAQSIRGFLRPRVDLKDVIVLDSDDLPLLNIVCGLCFSIGIRYAGTADPEAKTTLVYYLDQYIRLCSLAASTHDQRMTKATARTCQNVLALSCAIVMAGTGDLDVLRRLRRLHGSIESTVHYGSQLASHLALGILFVGGGEYSFDTSSPMPSMGNAEMQEQAEMTDEPHSTPIRHDSELIGIAGLVIALYPQFPNDVQDNQVHLQAFRHFWTFACQKRCLVVRDIETMRPVSMPVTIQYRDSSAAVKTESLTAPCLLPPLASLLRVRTVSPDHWPVVLDLQNNEVHARALRNTLTIYTEDRRSGYQRRTLDGFVPFETILQGLGPPDKVDDTRDADQHEHRLHSATLASVSKTVEKLLQVGLQNEMDRAEKAMIVPANVYTRRPQIQSTSADIAGTLAHFIENPRSADDLWNVKLAVNGLPRWAVGGSNSALPGSLERGKPFVFVPQETIERLKIGIWRMRQEIDVDGSGEETKKPT